MAVPEKGYFHVLINSQNWKTNCFRFAKCRFCYDICEATVILSIYHALNYSLYASFDDLKTWKLQTRNDWIIWRFLSLSFTFCDTARVGYSKHRIHRLLLQHGWPSGLSTRFLRQGSVVRAQLKTTFFNRFLLKLFSSNVYIYYFNAFNNKLQYMQKSVKRSL